MSAPLLADALPEFAQELETLLTKAAELGLAAQVRQLHIVDRCPCGGDFCATFDTVPNPSGSWGAGLRQVCLPCEKGWLILDVLNDTVVGVEVLDRPDIRQRLDEILPLKTELEKSEGLDVVARTFANALHEAYLLQDRFVPEPRLKTTGMGYMKSKGAAEFSNPSLTFGRPDSGCRDFRGRRLSALPRSFVGMKI